MKIKHIFRLIKIEHTLFILPVALSGAVLGAGGIPSLKPLILIIIAFTLLRTSAMLFNRVVDRTYDALNPRTSKRELPQGLVSVKLAKVMIFLSVLLFILTAWAINPLCGKLSPIGVIVVLGYSYTKRFTPLTHFILGICLGIAPVGAWIAIREDVGLPVLFLGAGVMLWSAGFDILYACQDYEFDKKVGLKSLPSRMGIRGAVYISKLCHFISFVLFVVTGIISGLKWLFYPLILITGSALLFEHIVFDASNPGRIQKAFFHSNVICSLSLLTAISAGTLLK